VLVRAAFVAEPIVAALRQAGIAVQLVTEREADTAKEVLATIAWLRLAMSRRIRQPGIETWNPAADDAFRRACAFPARGIGGALFGRLRQHAAEQGLALAAAVATVPATAAERLALEAVLGIVREIGDGVRRGQLGPADALRLAGEASEMRQRLDGHGSGVLCGGPDRQCDRLLRPRRARRCARGGRSARCGPGDDAAPRQGAGV
jgi:superfamily I DNA/RNA helicase